MAKPEIGDKVKFMSAYGRSRDGVIWFIEHRNDEYWVTIEVKKPLTYHYVRWEACNG